ncbi:tripartite tricarboxylate transporter substrate binding protein [Bordetella sp. BOR01]|uniref:tripartite tricarboxylate transporter substrate binding protein n=1 Tax=Bordetella sp. BOR01 TaxID=2854779 RepID=UPI001C45BB48|nr:tripartite tricarboxylate transporter substrate binding protein [Bordetella sp. BOR01]MBV7483335.1 tripartite tricarboxylate transporter substrate binding protein [Bordetella sp. BOR01]
MQRRELLVAAATIALATATMPVFAKGPYPNRPIRFIVPAGPGGITDVLVRVFGQEMSEAWGQPVIVENKAGGGGIIASLELLKAPADGYTLTLGILSHVINPMIMREVPFDFDRDFVPVAMMARVSNVISVHPSVPAHDLQELVALIKANPGKYSYGSSGNGQSTHLAGELFKHFAGVDMTHIPYKGSAPAMADALGGQIPVLIDSVLTTAPQARAGKLRALAVTGPNRSPALPDVPTVAEAGFPGYEASGWIGLIVRAGTPREIVGKLATEIARIAKLPEVQQRLSEAGADLFTNSPEEFASYIHSERLKWAPVVKRANMQSD